MELQGLVALITGSASGIGESTALVFAREGAKLLLTDINEKAGKELVNRIKDQGGDAVFIKADTSNAEDSQKSVSAAIENFGRLDIAVNNAGIGGVQAPVGDYEIYDWDKVIAVNLSGVFYGMRYQIPAMLKNGSGAIVNISSILGQVGLAKSAAYVAAKHGIIGLTKSAALEYSSLGIRVNSVGPAFINTPLISSLEDVHLQQLKTLHPIGRLGEPEEVAHLILWLAGKKASFATGAYYPIDGGYLAQ